MHTPECKIRQGRREEVEETRCGEGTNDREDNKGKPKSALVPVISTVSTSAAYITLSDNGSSRRHQLTPFGSSKMPVYRGCRSSFHVFRSLALRTILGKDNDFGRYEGNNQELPKKKRERDRNYINATKKY